jgi:serine/threonine protein kinase
LLSDSAVSILPAGAQLGPYKIEATIGTGGTGEVYRAIDTRLGRAAAIKVAAAKFSERFAREARAVAALNHSDICTLYDVGPDYLVMEYVDGQPLKGPLPLERAVEYARQILEALDAAHRSGIVHRDLKPANILVTNNGVKLLDFGLKLASGVVYLFDFLETFRTQVVPVRRIIAQFALFGAEFARLLPCVSRRAIPR